MRTSAHPSHLFHHLIRHFSQQNLRSLLYLTIDSSTFTIIRPTLNFHLPADSVYPSTNRKKCCPPTPSTSISTFPTLPSKIPLQHIPCLLQQIRPPPSHFPPPFYFHSTPSLKPYVIILSVVIHNQPTASHLCEN
jgi:hypothetical protein